MAMGLHFGVDEPPFATYFDVHKGYRVLTTTAPFGHGQELIQRPVASDSSLPMDFELEGRSPNRNHGRPARPGSRVTKPPGGFCYSHNS